MKTDPHEIASRLREIIQGGIDGSPGYETDKQIYSQMHGQVLRLLEWDVSAKKSQSDSLDSILSKLMSEGKISINVAREIIGLEPLEADGDALFINGKSKWQVEEERIIREYQIGNLTKLGVVNYLKRAGFNFSYAISVANGLK